MREKTQGKPGKRSIFDVTERGRGCHVTGSRDSPQDCVRRKVDIGKTGEGGEARPEKEEKLNVQGFIS